MKMEAAIDNRRVAFIGTGDFARAMATRLLHAEYSVTMGSRHPQGRHPAERNHTLKELEIVTIPEAIKASNIICVAVRPSAYHGLRMFADLMDQKILIDVSNPEKKPAPGSASGAERLASLFPQSRVVKAFNTVSAYALESDNAGESRAMHVCSNHPEAKQIIQQLASELGFDTSDKGGLQSSRQLEASTLLLFPGWGKPSLVMGIVFAIWLCYAILRHCYLRPDPYALDRIPTNILNKVFACTSISLLSLTYMPSCFAAFTQLGRGTKHISFHQGLDRWLRMRKQLGLFALMFALLHMCMSTILSSPAYYKGMYHSYKSVLPMNSSGDITVSHTSRLNWNGEALVCLGFLAVACMSLLGISSLPSVSNSFNWREWNFVQSHMGFVCLFLSEAHVTVKATPKWSTADVKSVLQGMTFLSSVLPYITLLMKMILCAPCVYYYLNKIRNGWERGVDHNTIDKGQNGKSCGKVINAANGNGNCPV